MGRDVTAGCAGYPVVLHNGVDFLFFLVSVYFRNIPSLDKTKGDSEFSVGVYAAVAFIAVNVDQVPVRMVIGQPCIHSGQGIFAACTTNQLLCHVA